MNEKFAQIIKAYNYKGSPLREKNSYKILLDLKRDPFNKYLSFLLIKNGKPITRGTFSTIKGFILLEEKIFDKDLYEETVDQLAQCIDFENDIEIIQEKENTLKEMIENDPNFRKLFLIESLRNKVSTLSFLYKEKIKNITTNTGLIINFKDKPINLLEIIGNDFRVYLNDKTTYVQIYSLNANPEAIFKALKRLMEKRFGLFDNLGQAVYTKYLFDELDNHIEKMLNKIPSHIMQTLLTNYKNKPIYLRSHDIEISNQSGGPIPNIIIYTDNTSPVCIEYQQKKGWSYQFSPNKSVLNDETITDKDLHYFKNEITKILSHLKNNSKYSEKITHLLANPIKEQQNEK